MAKISALEPHLKAAGNSNVEDNGKIVSPILIPDQRQQ